MKIDLHIHTRFSKRPANWLLKKLGCPESFTDPVACHAALMRAGMTHVTLTDHNTIDGCLYIAHLPNTFISEEITAYFPEDRCKVHVLAYRLTETHHKEIQDVRENLYELVAYLRNHNLPHAIAHPFSAVNDRFTLEHFERLLLLFRVFELNGDQEPAVNMMLRRVIESLNEASIMRLSEKHRLPVVMDQPWRKAFLAGSDDHAGTAIGSSFTRVGGAQTPDEFFAGIEDGQATLGVHGSAPQAFGRNIYSVAYRYLKDRFGLAAHSGGDSLLRFLDALLDPYKPRQYGILSNLSYAINRRRAVKALPENSSLTEFLRNRAGKLIRENARLAEIMQKDDSVAGDDGNQWYQFVDQVANQTTAHLSANFFKRLANGELFDLFHTLGSAGSLYVMLAPYFVAYPFHATERRLARNIGEALLQLEKAPLRVAQFVDTIGTDPGELPETMHLRDKLRLKIITCLDEERDIPGVKRFPPIAVQPMPELPEGALPVPPFLQILDYCYEKHFDRIHIASPGPCGFVALAIAKLLGLPLTIEFSDQFKSLMERIGPASGMEELIWRSAAWFANQTDGVYVFSALDADVLLERGFDERKLVRLCDNTEEPTCRMNAMLEHWQRSTCAAKSCGRFTGKESEPLFPIDTASLGFPSCSDTADATDATASAAYGE